MGSSYRDRSREPSVQVVPTPLAGCSGRPRLFEITTESTIAWPKRAHGEGTFVNTFEISPDGEGSRVVYRSEQLRFREPPWGLRYPLLRSVTYRIWIPIWSRRGFRNLLRMAEERSTATSPGSSVPMR